MSDDYFYSVESDGGGRERFFGTALTRGPWSNDHQHGGPPSALLVHAIEAASEKDGGAAMLTVRLTVDFLRPAPIDAPLEVEIDVIAAGRRVHRVNASLISRSQTFATASAVRIRVKELAVDVRRHTDPLLKPPLECRPMRFDFFQHDVGYHTAVEVLASEGEFGSGKLSAWMRPRVPLIDSLPTSAVERVMICADAGHGIGAALAPERFSFVNPDMTVYLHRPPIEDWLGMEAQTWTGSSSIGFCRTRLVDSNGSLGEVLQSQVVAAR